MEYASELKPVDLHELKEAIVENAEYIDHVYIHWTAGKYGQVYDDYHICIDHDGKFYFPHNDCNLSAWKAHTWKRNSNAVGIAMCACYDAEANSGFNADFGNFPVTQAQIECCAMIMAYFSLYGQIPLENMKTHCEAAYEDGYGPFSGDSDTRWDLWYIPDNAYTDGNGKPQMRPGGAVLRGKAQYYLSSM